MAKSTKRRSYFQFFQSIGICLSITEVNYLYECHDKKWYLLEITKLKNSLTFNTVAEEARFLRCLEGFAYLNGFRLFA